MVDSIKGPSSIAKFVRTFAVSISVLLSATTAGAQPTTAAAQGFYRQPALHGDQIWFAAEGDLWRVAVSGGTAQRVTTNAGAESEPAVSPDGLRLAFIAAYEGPREVYVMPVAGGVPQRLTWDGLPVGVAGWTPAGEVLLTASATSGLPHRQLVAIHPDTSARRWLPVSQASDGAFGADGRLYFTRHGGRNDNVRGYRGGAAGQIWVLDTASKDEAQRLVIGDDSVRRPMPYETPQGLRIAFLSDASGEYGIWSVDARGGDARQHARHIGWDVRSAGLSGKRVVYALGADLWMLDLLSQRNERLAITLAGDREPQRTRWVKRPQPFLSATTLAPDGERAALVVRGRVATQGVGGLRRAELPTPADARCREAVFSPDSRHIFALCDMSGEFEAWRFATNGSGTPVQLTRGARTLRHGLSVSPDGRWLAHADKDGELSLTGLTEKGAAPTHVIDVSAFGPATTIAWSPDSRGLVFTRPDKHSYRMQLLLFTLPTGATADSWPGPGSTLVLTSDRYDSDSPSFSPDGKWLYFLSSRTLVSSNTNPWGDRNLGPYFDRRVGIYALALQPGLRFPFQPRDELDTAPPSKSPPVAVSATAVAGAASATVTVTPPAEPAAPAKAGPKPAIVLAGLVKRLHEVPLAAGNYQSLVADNKRLYFMDADVGPVRRTDLRTLAVDNTGAQPELILADVKDFDLTPDGKKILIVRKSAADGTGDILIVDAGPKLPTELGKSQVRWTDWQIATDPRAEWRQMFNDAWRMQRDYLFDSGMRGVDWLALKRKYEPLLERVGDRAELDELLAQMVSELGVLHSQIRQGDMRVGPDDVAAAALGARTSRTADGFRIDHVYRGDAELPSTAGPLLRASLAPGDTRGPPDIGEVIVAVNGRAAAGVADLGELLRGQVGRQVLVDLQTTRGDRRQAIVLPVDAQAEVQLRTSDWETTRMQRVEAAGQGRIGYLRLRAMGSRDIASFAREFYAQVDRDGLIIDVRGNQGGNIDSWIIEKLLRRAWAYWKTRSPRGNLSTNMQQTFRGHLTVLVDQTTYSDGETFAEGVKRLKLGTVIGTRTAGAGVWLSDRNRLLDNGIMRAAENGQFAIDGTWLIEGHGVMPDIEVDNLPRATFDGADAQLDAAIAHLQRRMLEEPIPVLAPPAYPPRGGSNLP